MTVVPRLVLSAPSSGHGKNALAIGLLAALADRGLDVAGFKIGPDQVDAAYLGLASGRPGRTLDPRLVGAERLAPLLLHGAQGTDLAVVQGSMGLYDSLTGRSETESTAAVATMLRSPVVLVVDVAAMGQSVAALVHGFRAYDEQLWIGGVILNRVASARHEALLREALDDIGVPVYGALRRQDLPSVLPSRRHGVVPVLEGAGEASRAVRRLGEAVTATVDLGRAVAGRGCAGDDARPVRRRGAAGRHPCPGRRRSAARVVRGAALRQPAALHRGRRTGSHRPSGGRRGRRPALAGPRTRRAADVRGDRRDRQSARRAGGRLPGGDRSGGQCGCRPW